MKRKNELGALLLGLLLTGCGQTGETTNVAPVNVKTLVVRTTSVHERQEYSGTIEETTGTALSFPIGGTVGRIAVNMGQRVEKGALIATIDEESFRNAHKATAAMLAQAEDACQRLKQLHDNGSLPEIQWVEAQSKLKQAAASEQIAQKSLKDCRLRAPFSGVIAEKKVEVGQNVLPGVPVVKLVTIDQVKVKVAVPENEIAHIRIGQNIRMEVPALADKAFEGRVVEKGVTAHALSRSYEVKMLVDNPKRDLMPGMICQVHIDGQREESKAIFVLPVHVVQLDEKNRSFVWLNVGGKAEKRWIETGAFTAEGVIVVGGLAMEDEVIVEGQQKVSEHTQVVTERGKR